MRGQFTSARATLMIAALVAAITLAACEENTDTAPQATARPAATAITMVTSPTEVAMAEVPTLEFDGTEYMYAGPSEVTAGTARMTLNNIGQEAHHITLIEIGDGKTFADFTAALASETEGPLPDWIELYGGPNAAAPGESASTFVDLEPGRYALVCFIPDATGKPHFASGMVHELTVTEATTAKAEVPEVDTTVTAKDFAYSGVTDMAAGKHVITFTNEGGQPHEAALFTLEEGKTAADIAAAFAPGATAPPPGVPMGGVSGLVQGEGQTFEVDLAPGHYVYICFLEDPATGKMHLDLGMAAEFDVR